MNGSPFSGSDPGEDKLRRRIILIVGGLLIIAGICMLIGPSNILTLLHLRDLETEPEPIFPSESTADSTTDIPFDELSKYVVNTVPRLEYFLGYPYGQAELGGQRFYYFRVESGFELEFCTEGNSMVMGVTVLSVTLYDASDKTYRLSLTDGVPLEILDEFLRRRLQA